MDDGRLGREPAVEELLGVLVGAEVDGPGRSHAHQVRTQALEECIWTLLFHDDSGNRGQNII